ncbi:MAG: hypothetical protein AAF466_07680 [Bacteroidota bacterium]
MPKLVCTFLLLIVVSPVFAQTKYEKEVRIQEADVPAVALDYVNAFAFSKKIKWFKEYGLESTSIEAKTRSDGKRFSIEFNDNGKLEDVEIDLRWKQLPEEVRSTIDRYLNEIYGKYRLDKAQIQYSGDPDHILRFLRKKEEHQNITIRYELVIHARVRKQYRQFEYLFDDAGSYIRSAEIILRNSDNIEY